MEHYPIEIKTGDKAFQFEVRDYALEEETDRCSFAVYGSGSLVASFKPDRKGFLHVCENPGKLDNEILHAIAVEIEKVNF